MSNLAEDKNQGEQDDMLLKLNDNSRYDENHSDWILSQVALLRAGRLNALDVEHIADELEDVTGDDRRDLNRKFRNLIFNLLRWKYLPIRHMSNWRWVVRNERFDIEDIIAENPSLNVLSVLREKPRRSGRGWIARTAEPSCLMGGLLLLDVLPNDFNRRTATASSEIAWRPQRTAP